MIKEIRVKSENELKNASKEFLEVIGDHKIIAFYGKMGAGKTTFIKSICEELEVIDVVNSPTFSIINEYMFNQSESLFHFDFYRIESIEEAYDFGYEDYFYSGKICFIEWPEKIENLLPENYLKVEIQVVDDSERIIRIS